VKLFQIGQRDDDDLDVSLPPVPNFEVRGWSHGDQLDRELWDVWGAGRSVSGEGMPVVESTLRPLVPALRPKTLAG
jgi:hypothetical protein